MSNGACACGKETTNSWPGEPHRAAFDYSSILMTDDPIQPNTAEMEAMGKRILAIQERRRDRIRWHLGKHTAEMAIAALAEKPDYVASGKCRRRKRSKRLL